MPFPSQCRLQSREHTKGSHWHPQHRGQLSRDCAVYPITMLGTGGGPKSHTLAADSQPGHHEGKTKAALLYSG